MAAKYDICGQSFSTKSQVADEARLRLAGGIDDLFIRSLLSHHHEYESKLSIIGGQLLRLERRRDGWGNWCYWMVGPSGVIDISYRVAVRDMGARTPRSPESDHRSDFLTAMRCEIRDQIQDFIALKGIPPGWHVDHTPPLYFSAILDDWLRGRSASDFEVVTVDAGINRLVDRVIAADWQGYHRKTAKLRLMPPEQLADRPNKKCGA